MSEHQDELIQEQKFVTREKRDEPEKHSHIQQIKSDPEESDSDEGTISADEGTEGSYSEDTTFELEFLRNKLNCAVADCKQVRMEKAALAKKLNETQELLQQERRKSKKMQTRLRWTTARSSNRKKDSAVKPQKSKVVAQSSSSSDNAVKPETKPNLQHRPAYLHSEVLLSKNYVEGLEPMSGQKRNGVSCGVDGTLTDSQESKNLSCSRGLYEELRNMKNRIFCKSEDLLNENQVINLYSNVMKLFKRETEVLRQYKNVAEERIAHGEVCVKNSFLEILAFCESISREQAETFRRMKESALISTSENKALNELLKCKEEINELTNSLETERKSNLGMLQDNKKLSDENQKLVDNIVELLEETSALNSRVSEMSGTLTRNNEQINEMNSENERQALEISTMYKTISTLECNVRQLSTEKDAILQCHSKCTSLRHEVEDLRACYSAEHNKNADLSDELAVSRIKISRMEHEISNLNRHIDQLKLASQNLC